MIKKKLREIVEDNTSKKGKYFDYFTSFLDDNFKIYA